MDEVRLQQSEDQCDFKTPAGFKTRSAFGSQTPSLIIPPSPCMKKLGFGTGVNVYLIERYSPRQGCYKSPWAVKKINRKLECNPEYATRLRDEANVLRGLNHPNIIGFRSYTKDSEGLHCLAMESGQCSLSDIVEHKAEREVAPFPAGHILKVAEDIASALKYLHEEKHILHGDLKSANVLVKGDFESVKLCDFGVSLPLDDKLVVSNSSVCYVGTEIWSAPEVIHEGLITHKSDIFPFGLTLWEMISLRPPHIDKLHCNSLMEDSSLTAEELQKIEMETEIEYYKVLGTRPPLPDVQLDEQYYHGLEIFYSCTEEQPKKRPSAFQILCLINCTKTSRSKGDKT